AALSSPREIVEHLDEYIIGQERAKKVLAVAVFNHYQRVRANLLQQQPPPGDPWAGEPVGRARSVLMSMNQPGRTSSVNYNSGSINSNKFSTSFDKSNVLMVGPSGSGKTLLARTLAKILRIPFSMSDATPLTQAGYVGEDVEQVVHRLLQASDYDVRRAEQGIIFIDEIDKIARKSDHTSATKDVSGEGVQQALLRILEGTVVTITDKSGAGHNHHHGSHGISTPSPRGRHASVSTPKGDVYQIDTTNILFIVSGAFVDLDKIIMERIAKGSIGFGNQLRSTSQEDSNSSSNTTIKQNDLATHVRQNLLDYVEPADLQRFGFIPEFIGRLPVVSSVAQLTEDELVRILTEPRNALVKQYTALFAMNGISLHFSNAALRAIAKRALQKNTGARGLRRIMESILLDAMYDTPGSSTHSVVVDAAAANMQRPPRYYGR
ncbi:ClpX, ATPase regulatory subunit, partial [Ramicandelaber brevisporus]